MAAISFPVILILGLLKGYELSGALSNAALFSIGLALLPLVLPIWPVLKE
jgi:hypothetical protein